MQNAGVDNNSVNSGESVERTCPSHGGNIYEAAKEYGFSESGITDFSSNVNPLGPSPAAVAAAKRSLSLVDRYPDPEMTELRKAVSRYFGINPENVICGNGSSELIHLIPRVFKPTKVLIPSPTFSEYAVAIRSAGGDLVSLSLDEATGFRVDPLEMPFSMKGTDMAFLCNPNNPTGLLVPKTEMLEIVKYARDYGVRLVVDEGFMDFVNSESIVKEVVQESLVICVRSFSRFYGLPGLRIGYAVSDKSTISALRAAQEPWTLSIPSAEAAIAALADWRYSRRSLRLIEKERNRLLSDLRILPGVDAFPGSANFILIKVDASKAPLLAEKLAQRGLLVRDCSSFPGLDNRFIRITVRTNRDNKRLVQALRELLTR